MEDPNTLRHAEPGTTLDTNNQGIQIHNMTGGTAHVFNQYPSDNHQEECLRTLALSHGSMHDGSRVPITEGTCEWLMKHQQYQAWLSNGGVLFLEGAAATGKTTLMRYVVTNQGPPEHSNSSQISFFFRRGVGELTNTMLAFYQAVLHQLLAKDNALLADFLGRTDFGERAKRAKAAGQKCHWPLSELEEQFVSVLQEAYGKSPIRMYLDAIDECDEQEADDLIDRLTKLIEGSRGKFSLCASGRPFPKVLRGTHRIIVNEEEDHLQDIKIHLDKAFSRCRLDPDDVARIKQRIVTRSDGNFMWAALGARRTLDMARGNADLDDIADAVHHAPQKVRDLYREVLERIDPTEVSRAIRIFRWMAFATDFMTTEQLRWAVATDIRQSPSSLESHKNSKHWCRTDDVLYNRAERFSEGLVRRVSTTFWEALASVESVSHPPSFLQFVHDSVREYLREEGLPSLQSRVHPYPLKAPLQVSDSHSLLAICCIRHVETDGLLANRLVRHRDRPEPHYDGNHNDWKHWYATSNTPLGQYAANQFPKHAQLAQESGYSQEYLVKLTGWPKNKLWESLPRLISPFYVLTRAPGYPLRCDYLLHVAVKFRLRSTLHAIVDRCKSTEKIATGTHPELLKLGRYWRNACWYAVYNGDQEALEALHGEGVPMDEPDWYGELPIHRAARNGDVKLFMRLWRSGQLVTDHGDGVDSSYTYEADGYVCLIKRLTGKAAENISSLCTPKTLERIWRSRLEKPLGRHKMSSVAMRQLLVDMRKGADCDADSLAPVVYFFEPLSRNTTILSAVFFLQHCPGIDCTDTPSTSLLPLPGRCPLSLWPLSNVVLACALDNAPVKWLDGRQETYIDGDPGPLKFAMNHEDDIDGPPRDEEDFLRRGCEKFHASRFGPQAMPTADQVGREISGLDWFAAVSHI